MLPCFDGDIAAVFEVVALEVADLFGDVAVVDGEADFEVEEEAAHVHVDRAEEGVVFVYGHGFGVQQSAFEHGNFDACVEQHGVVGAGGVANHEGIDFGRQDQGNFDAAFGSDGQCHQEGFVGDEIGGGDGNLFGGGVNCADDGFVNDVAALFGRGGDDLGDDVALLHFFGKDFGNALLRLRQILLHAFEVFVGFDGEVGKEDGGEFEYQRAGAAHHDVHPFADAGIFFEEAGIGEVEAAGVADFAVDDEDFAVVAQVGAGEEGAPDADGQGGVDFYAGFAQGFYPAAVEKAAAADGVGEDGAIQTSVGGGEEFV